MKRFLMVAAAALVFAAGCTQPTTAPTGSAAPAGEGFTVTDGNAILSVAGANTTGVVGMAQAALMYTGHTSGEPTLGVSEKGDLYVTAITFDGSVPTQPRTDILRSADAGATWTDISPMVAGQKSHPITGDPLLYLDTSTGRLFDLDQFAVVGCDYVSSSDDAGATWTAPVPGCPFPPSDHPTMVTAKPTTFPTLPLYSNHLFVCINQVADTVCGRSLDGGATFEATTPPFSGVDSKQSIDPTDPTRPLCSGLVGHIKADASGVLYLPKDHCQVPLLATSTDEGLTWTISQVSRIPVVDDPAVAVDPSGTVYYAWVSNDGTLYLAHSSDHGATWSKPVDVRAPGLTAANLPTLAAGGNGRLALAYYGTSFKGGYRYINKPNAVIDGVTWDGFVTEITDAASDAPQMLSVRVNPTDDPLMRGTCGPGRCQGAFDFIDIQVDHDGRPWAAFVDGCTAATKCVAPGAKAETSSDSQGLVATLARGPDVLTGAALVPVHAAQT